MPLCLRWKLHPMPPVKRKNGSFFKQVTATPASSSVASFRRDADERTMPRLTRDVEGSEVGGSAGGSLDTILRWRLPRTPPARASSFSDDCPASSRAPAGRQQPREAGEVREWSQPRPHVHLSGRREERGGSEQPHERPTNRISP